jgi:Porin subfamily
MRHRANFGVDTRTQTAYGTLRTFMNVNFDNELQQDTVQATRAFIQWGGFTIGRTASFTDHEGSLGDSGFRTTFTNLVDATTGAAGINQIAYTWQLGNGITLNVGADDSRDRSLANLQTTAVTVGSDPTSSRHGNSHPDPWVALRVNQAWGRASLAFNGHKNAATYYTGTVALCTQTGTTLCGHPDDKWGWAVKGGIEVKLDWLSPGSRIGGYAIYGEGASRHTRNSQTSLDLFGSGNQIAFGILTDAVYVNGSDLQLTTSWAVGGGFEYFWTRNFSSTIYGGYTGTTYNDTVNNNRWFCANGNINPFGSAIGATSTIRSSGDCNMNYNFWQLGTHHDWFPVPGLRFALDFLYSNIDTALNGQVVTLGKAQGARPTGVYTVKDLGILSVGFRAQRSWGAGE